MADARGFEAEFDYIVVGGGSAGCVLASRLSEDPACRVCLVEAGGEARGTTPHMPAALRQTMLDPALTWGLRSEPEPALGGRVVPIIRGKVLGGCSMVNGMQHVRGDPRDFDEWAARGCDGWGYDDVLPYFQRAEQRRGGSADLSGNGPLGVRIAYNEPMFDRFAAAASALGYPVARTPATDDLDGLTGPEINVDPHGRRASTWMAYLRPALRRPNLRVITRAHGVRVVFEGRKAIGFEYRDSHGLHSLRSRREVILSGGTYGSPQLLMLSGVGDSAQLRRHGVDVVADLPGVGRNLRDHQDVYVTFSARGGTFVDQLRMDRMAISALRWRVFGSGPFASTAGAGRFFCHTDPEYDRPDIELVLLAVHREARPWLPLVNRPVHGLTALVGTRRSDSIGQVSLRSADPLDTPKIEFNLMGEASDMARMIRGIRVARALFNEEPLRSQVTGELSPGVDCEDDEALAAFIRANVSTDEHPVGTCAMGKDENAVVDPQLRVRGVEGLRVVDASVMPNVPSGHTNAPTVMIAEKAAAMMLGSH